MAHVSDLRTIQPEELPEVREHPGDEPLSTLVEHEHRSTDTGETRASQVHRAENLPCGYDPEVGLGLLDNDDDERQEERDSERQSIAEVIERWHVVEFCEVCLPELAAWETEPQD